MLFTLNLTVLKKKSIQKTGETIQLILHTNNFYSIINLLKIKFDGREKSIIFGKSDCDWR